MAALHPQAIRTQLDRLLGSRAFSHSDRMCRFLRLVVEYVLDGRAEQLKEYLLGVEVFDRPASYDTRIDPIVRVEARRLRAKLKAYYEGEGRQDEWIVELPTGSYVPQFRRRSVASQPAPKAGSNTVAVLPFSNLSSEPDNEYFSDGLTEELIHRLTAVEGLRVAAWSSVAKFRDRSQDIRELSERLGVGSVLVGSVRRAAERLRITAQLIRAEDGVYLWSETYDREMHDIFQVQEEIAQAIVRSLRIRLVAPGHAQPPGRRTDNLEAYNLYLKGRFHWNNRSGSGLLKSVECFEAAAAADPSFALAFTGVADAYTLLAEYGLMHPTTAMPKARHAAQWALELDPQLGEAYASLGIIHGLYDWDWTGAEENYRKAIRWNPGYATAHHWYGVDCLAMLGRLEEAYHEVAIARQLDPLSSIIAEGEAYLHFLAADYATSVRLYLEIIGADPDFYKAYGSLGRTYVHMGRYDEAIGWFEKCRAYAGDMPSVLGALGQTYGLCGRESEARACLEQLHAKARESYIPSASYALIHLGLGEREQALAWLQDGCAHHELRLATLKVHPAYDSLRGDPCFAEILRKLGLG